MNIHVDRTQENKSQKFSSANFQKQNADQCTFGFEDNRSESIAQRKLQQMANNSTQTTQLKDFQEMANNRPEASRGTQLEDRVGSDTSYQHQPIQNKDNNPANNIIQRMVSVNLLINGDDKKKIRAQGKVKDFKGGTTAGSLGWVGVTSYRSDYTISDGTNADVGDVGPLKNSFTNPEAGHVLARQNGGDGTDTWNVFAQDGGTNNGKYKSFEIGMRKDLDLYDDDDDVKFTSYLAGTNIEEGGTIVDEGLSDAMSISSEDSD